jgi:predicted lipoprotein
MNKPIKYILGIPAVLLVLFFSFDIKKLDEHKAADTTVLFNADEYARDVWNNKLPLAVKDAPEIDPLIDMLNNEPQKAFEEYGRKLGISKTYYFLTRGKATVGTVEDEFIRVNTGPEKQVKIATAFIFGNAVRDGSGVVDIDEFVNMTDFNNVSVVLNNIIREEVAAKLKSKVKPGMRVDFTGAFEIKQDEINTDSIRIIPVSAELFEE